jgi:hypothetical protein
MRIIQISKCRFRLTRLACACLCAAMLASSAPVFAQQRNGATKQTEESGRFGMLGRIGRWFGDQFDKIGSVGSSAERNIDSFNREAGLAAKATAGAAKDAADAVVRLPGARVKSGHQVCPRAPNGAPDCVTAAHQLCRAQGFESGKSLDITTAEECSAQVILGQRERRPGDCKDVSFVSRAVCQ